MNHGIGDATDRGSPPRALLTGCNGFMGQYMLELLVDSGYEVTATDVGERHFASWKKPPKRYCRCDIADNEAVQGMLRHIGPVDVVYHVAGLFDYGAPYVDLRKVNVQGVRNLMEGLARVSWKPRRFVMWGAAGVYDFAAESPAKETTPVKLKADYLKTKYMGEMAALELGDKTGVPATIVRPAGVYGPGSRYGVATSVFVTARGGMGPFFFGSKKTRGGTVHAIDVCRAALFLADRAEAEHEIYNVGDESAYTMWELTSMAARHFGFPLLPVGFPLGVMRKFVNQQSRKAAKKGLSSMLSSDMTDLLAHDTLLDISKLKALGWRPIYPDAKDGLVETLEWYEKEGWL